jgi:transposase
MRRAIGVDLHSNMFVVSFFNPETKEHRMKRFKLTELDQFTSQLKKDDVVGVEATTNTRYFVNRIKCFVAEVKVVNPAEFKVISASVKKTDEHDAKVIAEFLSKDMIPEVRMKSERAAELYSVANTRDKLVKLRTTLKNKIHSLFNAQGVKIKGRLSSEKALDNLMTLPLSKTALLELRVIVTQIKSLNLGIKELDKELEKAGRDLPGHENITSIKGIAPKSGTILLSVIDNIHNFESEKKLAAYFGIVPRVQESNDKHHYGHITKRGSKLGRTTLVQCTLSAIRYSPILSQFYHRLQTKKGSGKAIIATAKKMLNIIYLTLKKNWVYEDFANGILKTPHEFT